LASRAAHQRRTRVPSYPRRLWALVFGIPASGVGALFLVGMLVAHDELRRKRELGQGSRVRSLEDGDSRVRPQSRMQLAVADVDRDHPCRPGLKQAVGEAARGRADIRAIASVDGHTKGIESMLQLLSTSRHEARWTLDVQFGGVVQLLSGLVVAVHQAGEDERLRLGARLRKPPLDHEDVETLLHAAPSARCDHVPSSMVATGQDASRHAFIVVSPFHHPFTHPRVVREAESADLWCLEDVSLCAPNRR